MAIRVSFTDAEAAWLLQILQTNCDVTDIDYERVGGILNKMEKSIRKAGREKEIED